MTGKARAARWPVSIAIFAFLFLMATILSLAVTLAATRTMTFGFAIAPEAARTLATRIFAIRLFGVGFAAVLLLMVVIGRSRAARGALIMRWLLGLGTSTALLRGTGLMMPVAGTAPLLVATSAFQLAIEGVAIAILFGDDAADWFAPRPGWQRA